MTRSLLILTLLICGPSVLTLAAWLKVYGARRQQMPDAFALLALGIVSANAIAAAVTFLYYGTRPPSHFLPPWQDREIAQLGLLGLFSPVGMILGAVAGVHGAPKWLVGVIELASLPLLVVGVMAGIAV